MFEELKKTFKPPYSIKDLYSIFLSLFIMLAIPLTVIQISSLRDNRSSAATETSNELKVTVNSLTQNKLVSGFVTIGSEATDEANSIISVSLLVDGEIVATNKNQATSNKMAATFTWDTTKVRNGNHSVRVVATNSLGNKQSSTTYKLAVANNDSQKPSISFVKPSDGDYITETNYQIKITADDDFSLASVELSIDGQKVATFKSVPYDYNWDLTNAAAGSHTLSASATDTSGNSSSVSISIYKAAKPRVTNF